MDWIAHVTQALFSTYRGASKLPDDILAVEGYSSPQVRRLLNNLCDFDGYRYGAEMPRTPTIERGVPRSHH